jgi:hypothetical protein
MSCFPSGKMGQGKRGLRPSLVSGLRDLLLISIHFHGRSIDADDVSDIATPLSAESCLQMWPSVLPTPLTIFTVGLDCELSRPVSESGSWRF